MILRKEYLKYLITAEVLVPIFGIMAIFLLVARLFRKKMPGFKAKKTQFYTYVPIVLVCTVIFFWVMYNLKQSTLSLRYQSLSIFYLIAGSLHVYLYRSYFHRFGSKKILIEIAFTLLISFVVFIPVILFSAVFNDSIYVWSFVPLILSFLFPTLFFNLFETSVSIPAKIYNKWYYPLNNKYESPKHYELTNIIILNLLFYKNKDDKHLTSFKVKAPKDMVFGRLFYFFLNDYNNKKTLRDKIEVLDAQDNPMGWYFYKKPQWYSTPKHIDSDLKVELNKLKDGDSVVCQRI